MSFISNTDINSGIYFLDIEIGEKINEKNGLDLGELIKKRDKKAQLVFITSHKNMAFLTFERKLGAVNFIVKTGNVERLQKDITYSIENAIDAIDKFDYIQRNTFTYKFGHDIRRISMNDVICIRTTDVAHKLYLMKTTGWAEFIGTLKSISLKYSSLVKISESCIINPNNVERVSLKDRSITFVNGEIEYFSVRNTKKVKTVFGI